MFDRAGELKTRWGDRAKAARWLCLQGVVVAVAGCGAAPRTALERAMSRDTHQLGVTAMAGMYLASPGAIGEGGGGVALARPLWLGEQHAYVQFDVTARAQIGITGRPRVHPAVAVTAGIDLSLARWFSFEIHIGPMVGAQIDRAGLVPRVGLQGGGGYVFHPFDDHRRRITFGFEVAPSVALTGDPGNDCPMCPGYLIVGLGYSTPL